MHFCIKLEHCKSQKAAHHPTICDVINDVKLFLTVVSISQDILSPIFDGIQSEVVLQNQVHYRLNVSATFFLTIVSAHKVLEFIAYWPALSYNLIKAFAAYTK